MTLWQGTRFELLTAVAAALAIPFYLGFVHAGPPQLVLYSGVAGTAMATGEFAEMRQLQRGGFRVYIANVTVWCVVIGLLGSAAYLVALIF